MSPPTALDMEAQERYEKETVLVALKGERLDWLIHVLDCYEATGFEEAWVAEMINALQKAADDNFQVLKITMGKPDEQ